MRRQAVVLILDSLLAPVRPRAGNVTRPVVDAVGDAGTPARCGWRFLVGDVQRISARLPGSRRARCRRTADGARRTARTAACRN